MPNAIAYLALFAWPVITIFLFNRFPIRKALLWSLLGGYLALPMLTSIDVPIIPNINKTSAPVYSVLLALVFIRNQRLVIFGRTLLPKVLIISLLFGLLPTSFTNPEPLIYGPRVIPGLTIKDAVGQGMLFSMHILPFFFARQYLASAEAHDELLVFLVLAGLLYSLPMLLEVRLSPQLHTWIYGFFPHDFQQTVRQGGFRPMVFLEHGLFVAFLRPQH